MPPTRAPTGGLGVPMSERNHLAYDVVVVGGGPSGLAAATGLGRALGAGRVLVLEREDEPGGIPRHSNHLGYGVRDLRRIMTGPAYARALAARAQQAGAHLRTRAMVTGFGGDRQLEVTTPEGLLAVTAGALVLATGARERPRAARMVPGDRPQGVLTTGQLQNLVHLKHRSVGSQAVVVGAEWVSWSAVLTLREAGCRTVLMTTQRARAEIPAILAWGGARALRVPVATSSTVVQIIGRRRVEGIEVEDVSSGHRRVVACDTVVFTGDWVPDYELAHLGGLALDPAHRGPAVDGGLRTSAPGVFAVGNLVHPVDTADVCALDGAHVVASVLEHLRGAASPSAAASRRAAVTLRVDAPLRWVSPSRIEPGSLALPRGRLLLWTDEFVRRPRVIVRQDGRQLGRYAVPWPAAPGRVFRLPQRVLTGIRAGGGEVTLALS